MNNETNKAPLPSLALIAGCCAVASIGIAALAFCLLRDISGSGMWAIAAMTSAPSLMGIGMACFMTRQSR